jgi:hypothetical protein
VPAGSKVQVAEQQSPSLVLPSSHSSSPVCVPSPQPDAVVVVVVDDVVVVVVAHGMPVHSSGQLHSSSPLNGSQLPFPQPHSPGQFVGVSPGWHTPSPQNGWPQIATTLVQQSLVA